MVWPLRVLLIEREQRLGTGHDEASIEGFDERIEIRDAEEKSQHAAPVWKEEKSKTNQAPEVSVIICALKRGIDSSSPA